MPNGVRFVFTNGDGRINLPKPEYGSSFYEADSIEEMAAILRRLNLKPAYHALGGDPIGEDAWTGDREEYPHFWRRRVVVGIAYRLDSDYRQLWAGWIYAEPTDPEWWKNVTGPLKQEKTK